MIDMAAPPFRDLPNPYGVRVLLVAPMRVRDQLVGMLALDHGEEEHHFTADEVELTQTVARFAALVIERDRLLQGQAEARAGELALRETNRRMDEFLSIASHELRSPFTSVKGNVQVALNRLRRLMDGIPADLVPRLDAVSDILARADRTVDRAVRLIEDLLDLSRLESDHLELRPGVHDLAALVGEVVEEQRQAWPGRAITVGAPDAATSVEIDAERIRQVLTNYVTNALKYSDADCPVAVAVAVVGSEAWVRVRDEGPRAVPGAARAGVGPLPPRLRCRRARHGPGLGRRPGAGTLHQSAHRRGPSRARRRRERARPRRDLLVRAAPGVTHRHVTAYPRRRRGA